MKCQNCNKREATKCWIGEGSMLDAVHGFNQWWCMPCIIKRQYKYAKKQLKELPKRIKKLEKELKKLED